MSAPTAPALPAAPARAERLFPLLVRGAAAGDLRAWNELVRHANPIVRRAAAGFELAPADVDDVAQITWMRAFDRLHALRDPGAFVGWIAVTARREALRLLQRHPRELLVDDFSRLDEGDAAPIEDSLMERERAVAVHGAVGRLPEHQRRLLRCMLAHPGAGYAEIATHLEIPIGSIGPTRERALVRLRRDEQFVAGAAA